MPGYTCRYPDGNVPMDLDSEAARVVTVTLDPEDAISILRTLRETCCPQACGPSPSQSFTLRGGLTMTHFGYAPTQTIQQVPDLHRATAPAAVIPGAMRRGTLLTYSGRSLKDHGKWILDGPCACACGGLQVWRREWDGLHRLVHVSPASVTATRFRP